MQHNSEKDFCYTLHLLWFLNGEICLIPSPMMASSNVLCTRPCIKCFIILSSFDPHDELKLRYYCHHFTDDKFEVWKMRAERLKGLVTGGLSGTLEKHHPCHQHPLQTASMGTDGIQTHISLNAQNLSLLHTRYFPTEYNLFILNRLFGKKKWLVHLQNNLSNPSGPF